MKGLTLCGSDHMDTGDKILASRLVTDAAEQFIFSQRLKENLVCSCEGFSHILRRRLSVEKQVLNAQMDLSPCESLHSYLLN